ncbi:MAG: 50S ribosomal protein L13 [Clostridia bacterium]|nr:50S ribosomal protein L13 [Clostridia bacterium]
MNNTTHSVKLSEIEKKWYVIDAAGRPLGRVATEVARLLKGKHKPTYSTHLDCGDFVIVINTDKMVLTGNKMKNKIYRHHSGYIGNMTETSAEVMMKNHSDRALELAVKGMLPKNSLGRSMITKLKAFKGSEHTHSAQKPEIWNF